MERAQDGPYGSRVVDRVALEQIARRLGGGEALELEMRKLEGGLEASSVALVASRSVRFVAKRVTDRAAREAAIHAYLARTLPGITAHLWSVEGVGLDRTLILEELDPPTDWPWRRLEVSRRVLAKVAKVHTALEVSEVELSCGWDYEADLQAGGWAAIATLESAPKHGALAALRSSLPALRRIVSELHVWRAHLLATGPLFRSFVHGDLHSENVLFRGRGADAPPVFIDWGRARVGSPLEDVSSWLQSLGYWEPAVKRRHDTLLKVYLSHRGLAPSLGEGLRTAYWLAGASNALAGALAHHLSIAATTTDDDARAAAVAAARDWLRIIRRADARWSNAGDRRTGPRRTGLRASRSP